MSGWSWAEMLEEFRVLGGTAVNVEQRLGEHGHGLFPIDPARPVDVHVPERLLIPTKHVVEVGPDLIVHGDANADDAVRAFFTRYQREFSWGREGRASALAWFEQLMGLPPGVRAILLERLRVNVPPEPLDHTLALRRFVATRAIHYRDGPVIMPVVELINHAATASSYDLRDGVRVRGTYPGEVCACYHATDSLRLYFEYGVVSNERRAFSVPIVLNGASGKNLVVLGDVQQKQAKSGVEALLPVVETAGNRTTMSCVLLGHETRPRIPRSIFRRSLPQLGLEEADEAFQSLAGVNIQTLVNLLQELDGADSPTCRQLRSVIYLQLINLGHCYGTRDLDGLAFGGPATGPRRDEHPPIG